METVREKCMKVLQRQVVTVKAGCNVTDLYMCKQKLAEKRETRYVLKKE